MREIESIIQQYAQEPGIIAGVCSAEPFTEIRDILNESETPFVNYDVKTRIDPAGSMPNCKGIIVIGVSYNKKITAEFDVFSLTRGRFSINACGTDYHITVRKHLEELAALITEQYDLEYQIYVDTGPLVEREILYRAGLAWRGKNNTAVSDKIGSMFNCGYMLVNIPFVNAPRLKPRCRSCKRCLICCPTGALSKDSFDYRRCISYLTQKSGDLNPYEARLIGNNLYGCDICQVVCPYNRDKEIGEIQDEDEIFPDTNGILSLTRREFALKYKDRAFFWRGLDVLQRNARAAQENNTNR